MVRVVKVAGLRLARALVLNILRAHDGLFVHRDGRGADVAGVAAAHGALNAAALLVILSLAANGFDLNVADARLGQTRFFVGRDRAAGLAGDFAALLEAADMLDAFALLIGGADILVHHGVADFFFQSTAAGRAALTVGAHHRLISGNFAALVVETGAFANRASAGLDVGVQRLCGGPRSRSCRLVFVQSSGGGETPGFRLSVLAGLFSQFIHSFSPAGEKQASLHPRSIANI